MKPILTSLIAVPFIWTSISVAADLTIVTSDGSPAADAKLYRSFLEFSGGMGMGMDMEMDGYGDMDMEMGGDGGMEDMGGMGGYDDMMGMGMEMGYDDYSMASDPWYSDVLAFLNGQPLQPMDGSNGETLVSDDQGKVSIKQNAIYRNRGTSSHFASMLAVHESGVSFIPRGTRFSTEISLKQGGRLVVVQPTGIDPTKFKVLTCWQNGFAYPSLKHHLNELAVPVAAKVKNKINDEDWRFKPRFQLFHTAKFGETISVPPGEVRVSIVPNEAVDQKANKLTAESLFQALTTLGPSTIVLMSGTSAEAVKVKFDGVHCLDLELPKRQGSALPEWGDESTSRYELDPFNVKQGGAGWTLVPPPAKAFESKYWFADFLNKSRDQRSSFQSTRLPSRTDKNRVAFGAVRPGWYVVRKYNQDDSSEVGIPIIDWTRDGSTSIGVLAEGQVEGVQGAFELSVSERGIGTFSSSPAARRLAQRTNGSKVSKTEQLKLVRSLRKEIESTVARLIQQRRRLLEIETNLSGNSPNQNPMQDPFADNGNRSNQSFDPFGGGGGTDPFGGSGSPNSPANDPFGSSEDIFGDDPFGAGEAATTDPFGSDPFGDGSDDADPFG